MDLLGPDSRPRSRSLQSHTASASRPRCWSCGGVRASANGSSSASGRRRNTMTLRSYDVLLKMLMLGDSGVGKTCFMSRFAGEHVSSKHVSTIGVDFKLRIIDVEEKKVRVQLWDTAGQERFRTLTTQYYRKAEGILLVFDMTKEETFTNVKRWMEYIKEYAEDNVKVVLVANKYDLASHRKISRRQGEELAAMYNIPYTETSAIENKNVFETVNALCKRILEVKKQATLQRKLELQNIQPPPLKLKENDEKDDLAGSYCCS